MRARILAKGEDRRRGSRGLERLVVEDFGAGLSFVGIARKYGITSIAAQGIVRRSFKKPGGSKR